MEESKFSQTIQDGGALIKLENQTQMQISLQRPRSEKAILADALQELDLYPSAAAGAIYNKPVGKDDNGKQIYAQGLSIRAAESLASRWCNSAYGAEILAEEKDSILIGAVFLDMEKNTRHSVSRRVSKSYRARSGSMVPLVGDRLDMAVNANISKVLREVILRSLPAGLKTEYINKALEIIGKTSPDAIKKAIPKIVAYFKKHEVGKEIIEKFLGKKMEEMNGDDYAELQGIYNAVENGDIKAKEAFEVEPKSDGLNDKLKNAGAEPKKEDVPPPPKKEPAKKEMTDLQKKVNALPTKVKVKILDALGWSGSVDTFTDEECELFLHKANEKEATA